MLLLSISCPGYRKGNRNSFPGPLSQKGAPKLKFVYFFLKMNTIYGYKVAMGLALNWIFVTGWVPCVLSHVLVTSKAAVFQVYKHYSKIIILNYYSMRFDFHSWQNNGLIMKKVQTDIPRVFLWRNPCGTL